MTTPRQAAQTAEGRRFYRAVCATPFDDAPRLIFADWLDENGFPEQGEYIRLAVRLAGLSARDPEWYPLQRRAYELERAHQADWLWPVPDLFGRQGECHYSLWRGFLYRVRLPGSAFVRDAGAVFSLHPVTSVGLHLGDGKVGAGGHAASRVVLFDADRTARGRRQARVPGPIFRFLPEVGVPCTVRGARARFPPGVGGVELVSRACVAYGRDAAGLPPLTWGE